MKLLFPFILIFFLISCGSDEAEKKKAADEKSKAAFERIVEVSKKLVNDADDALFYKNVHPDDKAEYPEGFKEMMVSMLKNYQKHPVENVEVVDFTKVNSEEFEGAEWTVTPEKIIKIHIKLDGNSKFHWTFGVYQKEDKWYFAKLMPKL